MSLQSNPIALGKKPALILVDLSTGFTNPQSPLGSECQSVLDANKQLLDTFRAQNLPVISPPVIYRNSDEASVFRQKIPALDILTPESGWGEIDPQLAPLPNEPVLEKKWASSFFGTDLNERLEALNVDSLVVTGLTTSGCVRATAIDGLQYNYPVVVAKDACGDRDSRAQAASLYDLNLKYATVLNSEQIIQLLLSDAKE